ncbi:MAG: hypothetical protein MZV70_13360 [Desulfobacterales bacterium]|nr:hypothetical protein [Desulfobacterales bacterium]
MSDTLRLYGNAGIVLPGDLKGYERVELVNSSSGGRLLKRRCRRGSPLSVRSSSRGLLSPRRASPRWTGHRCCF